MLAQISHPKQPVENRLVRRPLFPMLLSAGLAFVALGVLDHHVEARTVTAFSGNNPDSTPSSCYQEYYGAIEGTGAAGCAGNPRSDSPRWEVPLPIDTAGSKVVTFYAKGFSDPLGNNFNSPACFAFTLDPLGLTVSTTPIMSTAANIYTKIDLTAISVLNTRSILALACGGVVLPGTALQSVSYPQ